MMALAKAKNLRTWRFCVRVAVALCLVVFSIGDAVERGFAGHVGLDAALTYAVSAEQSASAVTDHSGVHADEQSGDVEKGGQIVGHGCHGCAALPLRTLQIADISSSVSASLAWTSVPSTAGREPLVDLPPPRA